MSGVVVLLVDLLVLAILIHVARDLARKPDALVGHAPLKGYLNYFQADGVDDSVAIQAAIDHASRFGCVRMDDERTYNIGSPIYMKEDVTVVGHGASVRIIHLHIWDKIRLLIEEWFYRIFGCRCV